MQFSPLAPSPSLSTLIYQQRKDRLHLRSTSPAMATAYPLDTPSRVLRRVQQLEDMELPSLPSFQLDIDYESGTSVSEDTSHDDMGNMSEAVCPCLRDV